MTVSLEFASVFGIDARCIDEADAVAATLAGLGIPAAPTYDHAVIVAERVSAVAGPLLELGYELGSDRRAYPGKVDGHDFIAIAAGLPDGVPARARGWFEYVVISQPATPAAYAHLQHSAGRPFLHHACIALAPPPRRGRSDVEYAPAIMALAFRARRELALATGEPLQRMTMSVPEEVADQTNFKRRIDEDDYAVEIMDGGGFMLQFPSSASYRVEVMVREGTHFAFNNDAAAQLATRLSYAQGGRR